MELGLSLGETQKQPFRLFGKSNETVKKLDDGLGFCMGLALSVSDEMTSKRVDRLTTDDHSPSVELHLVPFSTHHKPSHQLPFPWLSHNQINLTSERINAEGGGTDSSSPDSSSFHMYRNRRHNHKREDGHVETERDSNSRGGSDDEDNGLILSRKKLRLTKDQSAFLEDSFKEHHTLNPKQKQALAKQLNLRPRQVEVWFQNRRARTKLKQTEVDCEYLKRCCETLTEENRRLQKELQELRALKSSKPFYMQLPATTLTMCPSCERVASTTTVTATATKPRLHPFLQDQGHALHASS
ncbi:hypothetical protein DCAR_0626655 [Daucus carota subsp. sativus]|uniref:Homeobox domain-containing protein n=1 Tax=Daucus carota subsp. sativus TaxID=79200 RepID=A0A164X6X8_DAUCS|nr:PREDICTED: homeobox-leucine zipper protein HOX11 [Daucus carota subsp. sativus]WOH07226.1 hypothetical protein DCAR_0626655 [Daucus carota subsp. sativus]